MTDFDVNIDVIEAKKALVEGNTSNLPIDAIKQMVLDATWGNEKLAEKIAMDVYRSRQEAKFIKGD